MNKKAPQPVHAGIGTSSVIMIFLVLCLTAFSVLSLISSRNSASVTDRGIEYTSAYYNAAALANEYIASCAMNEGPGEYASEFPFGDEMKLNVAFRVDEGGRVTVSRFTAEPASADTGDAFFEEFDF